MAWIEVHQSLRDHRKILALADELDMPEVHVAGHCLYLWLWSLDNAPDGRLPNSRRIIARAAAWTGDEELFVDALLQVGLLDRHADGSLYIHDWDEYAGRLISQREAGRIANANRQRTYRERHPRVAPIEDVTESNALRNGSVTQNNGPTVPNRTQQNSTVPSVTTSTKDAMVEAPKTTPRKSPPLTTPLDAILARVPSKTKEKFSAEEIQKQFDRALAWVSEETTRFMTAKFFADWLEREVAQGHVLPENASEVEKIQRILEKKPNEKGIIDGQTVYVWKERLRTAKRVEEAHAYEERCRQRHALDTLLSGEETRVVRDNESNHKTPS